MGTITQDSLLWAKKRMAEKIYENLGGQNPIYLEVLLYASALATPPFGQGGAEVLKEKFGFDKDDYTLKIAKEIGLSERIIDDLDKTHPRSTKDSGIVQALDVLLDKRVGTTPELEREIVEDIKAMSDDYVCVSNELLDRLTEFKPNALQGAKVAGQREAMELVTNILSTEDVKCDLVLTVLQMKETQILDMVKKNKMDQPLNHKR